MVYFLVDGHKFILNDDEATPTNIPKDIALFPTGYPIPVVTYTTLRPVPEPGNATTGEVVQSGGAVVQSNGLSFDKKEAVE